MQGTRTAANCVWRSDTFGWDHDTVELTVKIDDFEAYTVLAGPRTSCTSRCSRPRRNILEMICAPTEAEAYKKGDCRSPLQNSLQRRAPPARVRTTSLPNALKLFHCKGVH